MSFMREHTWVSHRTIAVALIATAAVWSTHLVVGGWTKTQGHAPPTPPQFDVRGTAQQPVEPARIHWTVVVDAHAKDEDGALRQLRGNTAAVRAFLLDHGVAVDQMTIDAPSTQVVTKSAPGGSGSFDVLEIPDGFDATQTFTVEMTDVKAGLHAYHVTSTAQLEATVTPPTCELAAADAVERALHAAAPVLARKEAEDATTKLGGTLGKLIAIEPGSLNVDLAALCEGTTASYWVHATYELD